jgi:hypothetical protein
MALQPHRLEFKPHRFEFIFAMVLAMAVTILAITTWAAPSNPDNDSAAPIPPIYQSDHRNLWDPIAWGLRHYLQAPGHTVTLHKDLPRAGGHMI